MSQDVIDRIAEGWVRHARERCTIMVDVGNHTQEQQTLFDGPKIVVCIAQALDQYAGEINVEGMKRRLAAFDKFESRISAALNDQTDDRR